MELKAEDLRIGNYVYTGDLVVKSFSPDGLYNLMKNIEEGTDNIKPIPLNEEWLDRFNAVKIHANYLGYKYSRFKLIWKESYKYWYVIDWQDETYMTKIEFVHEFQNFIKVMDGEEITVNN